MAALAKESRGYGKASPEDAKPEAPELPESGAWRNNAGPSTSIPSSWSTMRPCSLDAHVLFSLVFFVLSIHLGEDRLESEPSSPKLLRSERPTRIERTAKWGELSDEGGDVVYAVKNSELYRQSASLWSSGTAWEKVFLGESIALESIVISGDVIYAISVDRRLHQQNLKDLTPSAWLQIGSERNWTQVLPYRGTLYGISEKKILKRRRTRRSLSRRDGQRSARSFSNSSEDWTVWAWGEEWKQLAIGGSEEVAYGLSVEGKLFWQSFSSMSPNRVGVDKRIYQAKSEGGWSLSSSSTSNDWIAVMLGGGMIYALSNDQKLSRQALQELRESDGTSWSTASEQGFGSVALQRPGYTYYTLANSVQSAGWCVDEMRFFDQTGGLLHPVASAGARSLRHPSFCANSSGSLRHLGRPRGVRKLKDFFFSGTSCQDGADDFSQSVSPAAKTKQQKLPAPPRSGGWMYDGTSKGVSNRPSWVVLGGAGSLDGSSWMKLDLQKEVNSEGEWMNFPILSQICDPSESTDEQTCERPPCPEDCGVSDWSDWSCAACASRATRNRSLLSEAQHGGRCGELEQRGHACDPSSCPVDCVYNTWSQWSNCPVTCSGGVRTRNRTVKDEMRYGGKPCDGSNFQKEACNAQKCPVDCAWDDWGDFGPCSDSCGGGQQLRRRGTRPAQWGGRACEGEEKETVACALMLCPVDCQWSDWQTCGGGLKLRRRGIAVQGGYGGEVCAPDAAQEAIDCNVLNCSADCEDGSTPKQLPGAWGTLASGDLYEKLSSLAAQQGPEDICMEFPKPIFAAEEVVKVPLQSVTPGIRELDDATTKRPYDVLVRFTVETVGSVGDVSAWLTFERFLLPRFCFEEEPLAEKMMRLLQEESKKAALSAPQTGLFGEWSSDVNYMGVSIPGPLMPVHTPLSRELLSLSIQRLLAVVTDLGCVSFEYGDPKWRELSGCGYKKDMVVRSKLLTDV
eukprot:g12290.t1